MLSAAKSRVLQDSYVRTYASSTNVGTFVRMTDTTSTAPRSTSSADSTPTSNPAPKWQHELASSILAVLPISLGGNYIADLTARIVAIVVERVGAADEILHELSEKLDATAKSNDDIRAAHLNALRHATDVRRELDELRREHAQLGRDFDERCTQLTVARIELERCRDELHQLKIEATANRSDMHDDEEGN